MASSRDASADARAAAVPTTTLLPEELSGGAWRQTGAVVFLDWTHDGRRRRLDRSRPPIPWPRPISVARTDTLTIDIASLTPPAFLEVRTWQSLRPNGVPGGEPRILGCFVDSAPGDPCWLRPSLDGQGWRAVLHVSDRAEPLWIAANAKWEEPTAEGQMLLQQVAWIFSVKRPAPS